MRGVRLCGACFADLGEMDSGPQLVPLRCANCRVIDEGLRTLADREKQMSEKSTLEKLQLELRAVDEELQERLRALEQHWRELQLGVDIPLDDDYAIIRLNHKWRFVQLSDNRPVGDTRRDERAKFMERWGSQEKLEAAAERALRAILAQRKKLSSDK